jgi:hypothetical protein
MGTLGLLFTEAMLKCCFVMNCRCSIDSIPPLIPKMVYRAALATGEPEMYYSKFVMFQMGDFSELHAMCNVRLCITNAEAACDTQSPVSLPL